MSKGDPSRGGTMLARAALVDSDGSVAARLPGWRVGVLTVDVPL
jgi:hypothetical protein